MSPTTGYYSLIQYCPDRARLEVANMGVLLFCPERRFLRARLASSNRRIIRFFGSEAGDLKQISAMSRMLEHRLAAEVDQIGDVAALQRFARLLANEIIITDPRPTLVEEPEVELAQLFEELVNRFLRTEPPPERQLLERLRLTLETPRLQPLLRRNVSVRVPVIGSELTFPYAYQNGRQNLIEAHEFLHQREQDIVRDVLTKAAQGLLIFKHPDPEAGDRQLLVVASFGPSADPHRGRVEEVLRDHNVEFIPDFALGALEQRIAETAH